MKSNLTRAGDVLLLPAAVLLSAALFADATGRLASVPRLWTTGGRLLVGGIGIGLLAWTFQMGGGRGGRVALAGALLLIAAARWLRGTAAVPPDPPLLAAECIGVLLVWFAVRRRRREVAKFAKKREITRE